MRQMIGFVLFLIGVPMELVRRIDPPRGAWLGEDFEGRGA